MGGWFKGTRLDWKRVVPAPKMVRKRGLKLRETLRSWKVGMKWNSEKIIILLSLTIKINSYLKFFNNKIENYYERLQGTVNTNLGPERFADPKALDPNRCRQPTLWLHDLCPKDPNCASNKLHLIWFKALLQGNTITVAHMKYQH